MAARSGFRLENQPSKVSYPGTIESRTMVRRTSLAPLLVLLGLSPAALCSQITAKERTIVVIGRGEVTVAPDLAVLSAAVETTDPSARVATETNAEKTTRVVEAVKALLGENDSLRTTGFSLQPRYAARRTAGSPPEISGYVARNQVRIELRNLDAVGPVLDAALEAGANRTSDLRFERKDRSPMREALALAGAEARAQAESIAAALGVRLGKVLSATTGAAPPQLVHRTPMRAEMRAVADVATPIEAGELTLNATLTVTYSIEDSP